MRNVKRSHRPIAVNLVVRANLFTTRCMCNGPQAQDSFLVWRWIS